MDRRRRLTGSSVSGSLVYWSSQFLRQPARVLIIEALPPWWSDTCAVLCDALDNFLSLACSLEGPCRIPLLSLYAISRQQECLLPFAQVGGNLARWRSCVEELRSIPGDGCTRGPAKGGELLRQAVLDSLQQFRQFIRLSSAGITSVEVTVVTSRPGPSAVHHLERSLRDADLVSLKRLLVVQICSGADWVQDTPSPGDTRTEHEGEVVMGMEVDLQQVDGTVFAVETVLKTWLQEQGGDKEHLHLLLPGPQDNPNPVCLKCDMQERLISPALIPLTPNLGVKTESVRDFMPSSKGSANQSQAPQRLRVIKSLRAEGLCESVLYGLPLVLRPSTCWQLDWDEMESNHNLFQALCHTLRSRDLFLLLQVEPTQRSTAGGSGQRVYSHYVLQASPSLSLLLKPVVSRELFLPCSLPVPNEDPPPQAMQIIQGCVGQLEEECVFTPLSLSSNLYQHLKNQTLPSRPQHPSRLQPASYKHPSQPLEGPKPPASKQPRQQQHQGRPLGLNSRIRATVAPMPSSSSSCSSSLGPPSSKASRPVLTLLSSSSTGSRQARAPTWHHNTNDDDSMLTLLEN
ncbi:meiosis 1 arrest protein [Aulostomus maculatus]